MRSRIWHWKIGRIWHGIRNWSIGGIGRRWTAITGQARKVVSIVSELAGQTITANIVVFAATCPAIATVFGRGTIWDPTNVRVGAAHARIVGITAPIDALFVVLSAASVVVGRRSREGHGRAGGWAGATDNRTKVPEACPVGRFLFASVVCFFLDPIAFFLFDYLFLAKLD